MELDVDAGYGIKYPVGGFDEVRRKLERACTALGVEIRTGADVSRVDVDDGRATGVTLADGSRVAADAVVVNADLPLAERTLVFRRAELPKAGRGDAAAATWIFRGDNSSFQTGAWLRYQATARETSKRPSRRRPSCRSPSRSTARSPRSRTTTSSLRTTSARGPGTACSAGPRQIGRPATSMFTVPHAAIPRPRRRAATPSRSSCRHRRCRAGRATTRADMCPFHGSPAAASPPRAPGDGLRPGRGVAAQRRRESSRADDPRIIFRLISGREPLTSQATPPRMRCRALGWPRRASRWSSASRAFLKWRAGPNPSCMTV